MAVKILVRYRPTAKVVTIKRYAYLEGQLRQWADNLDFAQRLDKVLWNNGRIVWVGGKEDASGNYPGEPWRFTNMEEERASLAETIKLGEGI